MKRSQRHNQEDADDALVQPLLSIPEVAKLLRLSRPKVYDLIHDEGLPVIHFGRAARVSPVSLRRWLARREQIA